MPFGGSCVILHFLVILVIRLAPLCGQFFLGRKLEQDLKPEEVKQKSVCDLCDADYVGFTARHLFRRVAKHKNSEIGKHFHEAHGRSDLLNDCHFKILRNLLN